MKNSFWIVLLVVLALVCGGLSLWLFLPGGDAAVVYVYSDGALVYTLPLSSDQEVTVTTDRGTNVVRVQDGKVAVTEADCPDHYCMKRGFCAGGTPIVCLPNRLVLEFGGQQPVDAVVG